MQKDICLFDLDGTLIDSKFGILNCLRYALLQNGIDEQDPAVLDEFVGPPLYDTFIRVYGFSHEKSLEATATYRRRFAEKGVYEHKIYEGAKDMLKALKAAGKKIMLATSKPLPFAKSILQQYELTALFDFIGGSNMDNTRSKKAEVIRYIFEENGLTDADKPRIIMVGDRRHDVEGAKATGIACIGCVYGYGGREELITAGADALADTIPQLTQMLLS